MVRNIIYTNPRPLKIEKNITNRKWIVFGGKSGWVGQKFVELLKTKYRRSIYLVLDWKIGKILLLILKNLNQLIINAAGLTGNLMLIGVNQINKVRYVLM